MPIEDDRYHVENRDKTKNPDNFDFGARLHDLLDANLINTPYHWLELAAEDIYKATIPPPDREEPLIDINKPYEEYEKDYSDHLFNQEESKKRTEENLANRADRLIGFIYDKTAEEYIKKTPGLADRMKSFITDFRENGPPDICSNKAVQKFLTIIEDSLA